VVKIAPSILAADFSRLGDVVAEVEPVVDLLHIDVMDGHFVPNISLGMPVIASLRKTSQLFFDCHLMVTNPEAHLEQLAAAGADLVTVHVEVVPDPTRVAKESAGLDLGFGLVLNPATSFDAAEPYLELASLLLIMSVEPGFGGQRFISSVLPKIETARRRIDELALPTEIEVDGGVTTEVAGALCAAGADILVAGTAVFGAADPVAAVAALRTAAAGGAS
jgi:ribulose-phosphate 3-epimerase